MGKFTRVTPQGGGPEASVSLTSP